MLNTHKYRKILLILLYIMTIFNGSLFAQHVYIPDTILVQNLEDKGLVFEYRVKKGNTMYSISKLFNADLIDLYAFNDGVNKKPLSIGTVLYIPFDNQLLDDKKTNNKIVMYRVGKKENLFRISKMYFGIDVEKVKKLNNLKDNTIQPGQYLMIGTVNYENANTRKVADNQDENKKENTDADEVHNKRKDKIESDEPMKKIIVKDSIEKEIRDTERVKFDKIIVVKKDSIISKKDTVLNEKAKEVIVADNGIALWNKSSRTKGVFVLNNNAKINSLMEIYNPMLGRKIFAKVIGRIPPNSYPANVKVILSPQAATSLGAINTKFYVEIKYNKN